MKKSFLTIMVSFTVVAGLFAQTPEIKGAEALIRQNPPDVLGAKKSIDKAGAIGGAEADVYYWYVRGAVYTEFGNSSNPDVKAEDPDAAIKATDALAKFYAMAKDDVKATRKYKYLADNFLPSAAINAFNKGIRLTTDTNYVEALKVYESLANLVRIDENGGEVLKAKVPEITYNSILKNAYITAYRNNDNPLTRKYLNLLIDNKYADPLLYVYIAKTYENEDNTTKQLESIKKGRIAYPDSKIIINEEINYYIKNNDLITLKKAIEKEIAGGNAESNFYYIRGFVNDQIGNGKITTDGREITFETEKDTAILRLAEKDYLKAIELDPNSLNAIYNIATLYVNFGNYWNKKASLLPYSATKQFDDYTEIQNVNYNKAIAYYEKADGFTDLTEDERKNMYLDLRQLYAKLKKMDKVKEMNTKIQEME